MKLRADGCRDERVYMNHLAAIILWCHTTIPIGYFSDHVAERQACIKEKVKCWNNRSYTLRVMPIGSHTVEDVDLFELCMEPPKKKAACSED